jgi:aspartate/methionine/tyrosine aminotransferase
MKKYDMGWGESVCVRTAFLETANTQIVFHRDALYELSYPNHFGEPDLVGLTKKIIKRQTGNDYDYVVITNGATGGVTIALRSFAVAGGLLPCVTRQPPYFRLYPGMIKAAGLRHVCEVAHEKMMDAVYLVDSLSNPLGTFSQIKKNIYNSPIVWDSVYYGRVYAPGRHPQPDHDVLVGSYSKLTGLNGLRVGWIASNDPIRYEILKGLVESEYCGISAPSTKIIMETAGKFTDSEWALFEKRAQTKLDRNREEFSKLEKFFAGMPVGPYGMFYYAPIDSACKKLLEKSGVIWSLGSHMGSTDDFGRFNIGQDNQLVMEAVSTVLKNDRR